MNFKIHRISKGRKVKHKICLREREAYNNKSNVLVQARHLYWSMSVKSSIVSCLSNATVRVRRNCWERTLKITVIKYFWNDTFKKKKITIIATVVVLIHLFSLTVASKQKIKMKTWNTMALSYHSKVTSTQKKGVPYFSCLACGV